MTPRRGLAIVLLMSLPTLVAAQRPGMSTIGRGMTPKGPKRDAGIEVPATINVVNLVMEHRQDLILTDTQFVRVVRIKRALDSTNAPLLRRIDSVQRIFKNRPIFAEPSVAHRDSLSAAMALVKEMTADIDDNIADAKDKMFAFLSAPQKERAEQFEDKARKASESAARGRL